MNYSNNTFNVSIQNLVPLYMPGFEQLQITYYFEWMRTFHTQALPQNQVHIVRYHH